MWCEGYAYIHVLIPSSPISRAMMESVVHLHTTLGVMVTNLGNTKASGGLINKVMFVRAQAMGVLVNGLGTRELTERVPWSNVVDTLRYAEGVVSW